MTLPDIFHDYETIRTPIDGFPQEWNRLVSMGAASAKSTICGYVGLKFDSEAHRIITGDGDFGLLVPKRKRDRNNRRFWRLGVQISDDLALYFTPPQTAGIVGHFPENYTSLLNQVGVCHFTQYGGHILSPGQIESASRNVNDVILLDASLARSLTVFFDHETGDYDCWRGEDRMDTYFFDHETHDVRLYSIGGFAEWFEKRFMACLEV